MTKSAPIVNGKPTQHGVALLIALVFLVVLTLLALSAMQGSVLEERMTGNFSDRTIAMDAAYAALRDAERDIRGKKIDATDCEWWENRCRPFGSRPYTVYGQLAVNADENCSLGECGAPLTASIAGRGTSGEWDTYLVTSPVRFWDNADNWRDGNETRWDLLGGLVPGRAVLYRTFTGESGETVFPGGVALQPRYIIEVFNRFPGELTEPLIFRITARGWGKNAVTQVTLQEIFAGDQ